MAQAVITVMKNLSELLIQEATFLYGIETKVQEIEKELQWMVGFLQDADQKETENYQTFRNWIEEVRDVAYEAEDLIENYILNQRGIRSRSITRYLPVFDDSITLHQIGCEIDKIEHKITGIAARKHRYHIDNLRGEDGRSYIHQKVQERRNILPHYDDPDIVGFEDHKKEIIVRLLNPKNKRRSVISIVGMGGQGKTTLAKLVYNSTEVHDYFSICIWITVSNGYKIEELLREMIRKCWNDVESLNMKKHDLKQLLYDLLKDARYLIVMDDVWSADVWKGIVEALPENKNGSRILFTTRSMEVAKYADPASPSYKLKFLESPESWDVFLRKAFPDHEMNLCCPEELEDLGVQLVKRCDGLPLALVILGGYLSTKPHQRTVWLRIKKRLIWDEAENGLCLEILSLSYNDLPYCLKPCFLYLGSYPGGSGINVSKLIMLWIGEGFIPKVDGQTLEETAEDYVDMLVQRCMVQVVERKSDGRVKKLRVHDLVRDLSIVHSRADRYLQVYGSQNEISSCNSRRVALLRVDAEMWTFLSVYCPNLRTILCFNVTENLSLSFNKLELLRVIDLEDAHIYELPEEINRVVHLRYLGLRSTKIKKLPKSVKKLHLLRTIDVRNTSVETLPSSFWTIPHLRHALFTSASVKPQKTIASTDLQALKGVRSGSWIGNHLHKLPNLRGLAIVELATSEQEKMLRDALKKLVHLASLRLSGNKISAQIIEASSKHERLLHLYLGGLMERLPDNFPVNLTKLTLENTALGYDPMVILEKMKFLRVLRLRGAYKGKEIICTICGFPRLQSLDLHKLLELESWRLENGAMSKLIKLSIKDCDLLKMLPDELQKISTLRVRDLPPVLTACYQSLVDRAKMADTTCTRQCDPLPAEDMRTRSFMIWMVFGVSILCIIITIAYTFFY